MAASYHSAKSRFSSRRYVAGASTTPLAMLPRSNATQPSRSLVFSDPAAPPSPVGFKLSLLRRMRTVLEGSIDLKNAETTNPWLGLLTPVTAPLEELDGLLAIVDALLLGFRPAPPSEDAMEAVMGRIFMARQEVALYAAGCSDVKDAVERLPTLTHSALANASTIVQDLSQPQLMQARPYGSAVWFVPRADTAFASAPPAAAAAATTTNTSLFVPTFPPSSHSSTTSSASASSSSSSTYDAASPSPRTSACPYGFVAKVTPCHSPAAYAHLQSGGALPNGQQLHPTHLRSVEEAAIETINAGGLQDAAVALHGEDGPFLAPLFVTVRPLAGPPLVDEDRGFDLEVVCIYEYLPDGDGVEVATSRVEGILEAAYCAYHTGRAQLWDVTDTAVCALSATLEELVGCMAAAVARAHALGCVVSDNKPFNFLPGARGGRGLLTDSEAVDPCGPHEVLPGSGIHTPMFAAPEQMGLDGGIPRRCQASDVWSLGSTATALLMMAIEKAQNYGLLAVAELLQAPQGPAARLLALGDACMDVQLDRRPSAAEVCAMLGL
ncbi:hypothetical protein GPECTOR_47g333 [Gonium pectorale]|uniref:Protein kinase domain-containing protein n=1 Tax=Gonium pectorale TaxID=33097 RepID=A0A150G8B1_GONPE|nr:hypothetical protein GPECTOR_47g333 [Gonium pectorale]|eukprot:KXZ46058.1 hypothetical protein GPECTOR_47g333 [Gonium pectorale]